MYTEEFNKAIKDHDLCRTAARRVRNESYDGVHFKCFNKEDANNLKRIMGVLYPDIKVHTTCLFGG